MLTFHELQAYRLKSDDTADQLIQDLYQTMSKADIGKLFRSYMNDLNDVDYDTMPQVLLKYFQANQNLPEWTDYDKIKHAETLFLDIGPVYSACLLCRALPAGYTARNVVKVLTTTGYLSSNVKTGTAKRLLETTQFVFNVMSQDALLPDGKGIKHTLKVRFIHAMIRYHMNKHHWDAETYGIPINQEDMAGTILTFSIGAIKGVDKVNINLTNDDKEALTHFWAVIGHVIGLVEELNPRDYRSADLLYEKIFRHQAEPSEDGEILTHALSDFVRGVLRIKAIPQFPEYLIRFLIDNESYSNMIGLPKPQSTKDKVLFKNAMNYLCFLNKYRKNPVVAEMIKPANRMLGVRMIDYFDSEFNLKLHIPKPIEKAWGLRAK